ncbi:unnamed protein product [Aphanomyces euteiches]
MAKKTWSMRRTSRNDDGQHMLTVGSHVIRDAAKDTCGSLVRTFPLNSAIDTLAGTVRLDVVFDSLQYVRGSIFEHMSGTADTRPAPPDATHDVLTDFGYKPTRMDCDMSLTTPIQVPNASGVVVSTNTSMFRFYAKSFCTACPPIVEFGHDICALNVTYNATAQTTTVLSSKARIGGVHMVGLMLRGTAASVGSLVVCAPCPHGHLWVHRKPKDDSLVRRDGALDMVQACDLHDVSSHLPLQQLRVQLLELLPQQRLVRLWGRHRVYSKIMFTWNEHSDSSWIPIQIFAIEFRWLWLNCAFVKLFKFILNFVSLTRYTGKNLPVGLCNFSSVFYIYLGAVVLLFRIKIIVGINSDMVGPSPKTQPFDGLRLDVFDGYYIRAVPDVLFIMAINLAVVLTMDHLVHL